MNKKGFFFLLVVVVVVTTARTPIERVKYYADNELTDLLVYDGENSVVRFTENATGITSFYKGCRALLSTR